MVIICHFSLIFCCRCCSFNKSKWFTPQIFLDSNYESYCIFCIRDWICISDTLSISAILLYSLQIHILQVSSLTKSQIFIPFWVFLVHIIENKLYGTYKNFLQRIVIFEFQNSVPEKSYYSTSWRRRVNPFSEVRTFLLSFRIFSISSRPSECLLQSSTPVPNSCNKLCYWSPDCWRVPPKYKLSIIDSKTDNVGKGL